MPLDANAIALPLIEALRGRLEQIEVYTFDRELFQSFLLEFGWDAAFTDAELAQVRDFLGFEAPIAALGAVAEELEAASEGQFSGRDAPNSVGAEPAHCCLPPMSSRRTT